MNGRFHQRQCKRAGAVVQNELKNRAGAVAITVRPAAMIFPQVRAGCSSWSSAMALEMAAILVAPGRVEKQIAHAAQIQALQLGGAFRADAAQLAERRLQRIWGGFDTPNL